MPIRLIVAESVRQTWRYLLSTKALALEASASAHDMAEYLTDDPTYRDPLFFAVIGMVWSGLV
ncbi:hypothetical protein A1F99_136460 [Pyrenophora tritici-repentis]|nr:hypothetical protein A1F99_136460 [Pyrenophora tritici-repentis]